MVRYYHYPNSSTMTALLYIHVNKCPNFTSGSLEIPRLPNQQPKHLHPIHALQGNDLCLHGIGQTAFQPVQDFADYCHLTRNIGSYKSRMKKKRTGLC